MHPSGSGSGGTNMVLAQATNISRSNQDTNSNTIVSSGLSVTITPSSASKRILVEVLGGSVQQKSHSSYPNNGSNNITIRLYKDSSSLGYYWTFKEAPNGNVIVYNQVSIAIIDSPNTTSAVKYELYWQVQNNSSYGNASIRASTATPLVMKATEVD